MSDRIEDIVEHSSNSSRTAPRVTPGGLPPVPTTKVLAIGQLVAPLTLEQRKVMRPKEVPATLRMYLDGKIDQWWFRKDEKGGIVFLMNATSVEEANRVLEKLPLHQAKLLTFELIPLGPLAPLHVLLDEGQSQTGESV